MPNISRGLITSRIDRKISRYIHLGMVCWGTIVVLIGLPGLAQDKSPRPESARASTRSFGSLVIGMTVARASVVTGLQFTSRDEGVHCRYYQAKQQLKGVDVMVTNGKIARVDISNPQIKTLSGIKIGDREDQVKSVYGDRLQIKTHPYNKQGHYLIYIPRDRAEKQYRIIFETNGRQVVNWRFGRVDEVNWVEGCS
jgi:hypothetical protein